MNQQLIWAIFYSVLIAGAVWAIFKYRVFFRDAYLELIHKVTWPSWREVQGTTAVVLIATFAAAIYLFLCDIVLQKAIMGLLRFARGS
jgi:preprotein translocase subunit SecE